MLIGRHRIAPAHSVWLLVLGISLLAFFQLLYIPRHRVRLDGDALRYRTLLGEETIPLGLIESTRCRSAFELAHRGGNRPGGVEITVRGRSTTTVVADVFPIGKQEMKRRIDAACATLTGQRGPSGTAQ